MKRVLSSTAFIPEEVYQHLPAFITRALEVVSNPRGKDMLLLGILANLSACMPEVNIIYDQCPYSPHLYILIIANSAAGKGILSLANILPTAIDKHLQRENKRKKDDFERELQAWEQHKHSSHKETQETTTDPVTRP